MSDEMAVTDNVAGDEAKIASAKAEVAGAEDAPEVVTEPPAETPAPEPEQSSDVTEELTPKEEPIDDIQKESETIDAPTEDAESVTVKQETEDMTEQESDKEELRGIKRRASVAFSEVGDDEFKGFDTHANGHDVTGDYGKLLERLEAEVIAASKEFVHVRQVMGSPTSLARATKRPRKDTDGSRPSSAMSSRSDGDGAIDGGAAASPGGRRRVTTEMSSPALRVPLERGWKRELVFRAALDTHTKRNADIYYYTPQGKKLRSSREVAEHLSGTGLTLDNFSFFKEPLGVDDPEKEIIRDAKMIRRVESPVQTPVVALEGKRTPKPKAPKGASPEPPNVKSPPAKIKVKSMGSRLSTGAPPAAAPAQPKQKKPAPPADNNNTAAWKKPRAPPQPPAAPAAPVAPAQTPAAPVQTPAAVVQPPAAVVQPPAAPASAPAAPPKTPPPLQSRPAPTTPLVQNTGRVAQPCSMYCGRGAVPSLACAACLCLYHPACAGYTHTGQPFLCKNCRKSCSPPADPPPLTHKSGVSTRSPSPASPPRRAPLPVPVPVPVPTRPVRPDNRLLLKMKQVPGGGERMWAVGRSGRPSLPQSLALFAGRRFIVVPRSLILDNDNQ